MTIAHTKTETNETVYEGRLSADQVETILGAAIRQDLGLGYESGVTAALRYDGTSGQVAFTVTVDHNFWRKQMADEAAKRVVLVEETEAPKLRVSRDRDPLE